MARAMGLSSPEKIKRSTGLPKRERQLLCGAPIHLRCEVDGNSYARPENGRLYLPTRYDTMLTPERIRARIRWHAELGANASEMLPPDMAANIYSGG